MINRMMEEIICGPCNGTGYFPEQGEDCETCKTKGYIVLSSGRSICPTCNGDGYHLTTRKCKDCCGKGRIICIYEIAEYVQPCSRCTGTGSYIEEIVYYGRQANQVGQRTVECCICHGTGSMKAQRIRRVK